MASLASSPVQSPSPTRSPAKKKRKLKAQSSSRDKIRPKILEDTERSDVRVAEEEFDDKELWVFQLPKNVSNILVHVHDIPYTSYSH